MGVLLLIRHGRTAANVDGVLAGRLPGVTLDDVGRETASRLSQRLENVTVTQVVSSPLERTVETAQLVFADRVPVALDNRLVECDYGDWQGRLLSELALEDMWKVVQQRPDEMIFPNGEAMSDMAKRAASAMREWDAKLTEEHGSNVVWAAISHGDVIKAICADALGLPLAKFQKILVDPASVSVIHYGEHGSSVAKLNDTGDGWIAALNKAIGEPTLGGQSGKEQE